jgi:hypothetical protein
MASSCSLTGIAAALAQIKVRVFVFSHKIIIMIVITIVMLLHQLCTAFVQGKAVELIRVTSGYQND